LENIEEIKNELVAGSKAEKMSVNIQKLRGYSYLEL
jgi:hypothetical protein